jgi:hypothetical protein|tara:strand:+ start:420 stop:587 length:168 start_codon:yes stop_codon:yes gene_type:complete
LNAKTGIDVEKSKVNALPKGFSTKKYELDGKAQEHLVNSFDQILWPDPFPKESEI